MLVWFSDDEQHLPLRIKLIVAVGRITATLRSVGLVEATAPTQEEPGPAQNECGTDAIFYAPAGISHF